jgi:hypothetical protein
VTFLVTVSSTAECGEFVTAHFLTQRLGYLPNRVRVRFVVDSVVGQMFILAQRVSFRVPARCSLRFQMDVVSSPPQTSTKNSRIPVMNSVSREECQWLRNSCEQNSKQDVFFLTDHIQGQILLETYRLISRGMSCYFTEYIAVRSFAS